MSKPIITPTAAAVGDHLQRIKDQAAAADARPSIRQLILHVSGEEVLTFMEPAEVFDECIVGVAEHAGRTVAVYNKMAVLAALASHQGIDLPQAVEVLHNSFGSTAAQREITDAPPMPIFVVDIRDL